jgi:hypothetical protein
VVKCNTVPHNKAIEHLEGIVLPVPEHHTMKAFKEHGSEAPLTLN